MAVRFGRFCEQDLDGIIILKDREELQKQMRIKQGWGYGHILNDSLEKAIKQLDEDKASDSTLREAWEIAEKEVAKKTDTELKTLSKLPNYCKVAIYAYTLDQPKLYFKFNAATRELTHSFSLVDYKYIGLHQLLNHAISSPGNPFLKFRGTKTVYRGCPHKFSVEVGNHIMFRHFVSASKNEEVAKKLAKQGTLFVMDISMGIFVKLLSWFPHEDEYLMAPNDGFLVTKLEMKDEMRIIHMKTEMESYHIH